MNKYVAICLCILWMIMIFTGCTPKENETVTAENPTPTLEDQIGDTLAPVETVASNMDTAAVETYSEDPNIAENPDGIDLPEPDFPEEDTDGLQVEDEFVVEIGEDNGVGIGGN